MLTIELADVMLSVDYRQDSLPAMNVGLYEAFCANGKVGRDALAVYLHLGYTYRRQHTNRVWASNTYLSSGLGMGTRRVAIAKSLLAKMSLISAVQIKDARGRVTKTYTLLNLLPNPGPSTHAETALVENPPMQKTTRVDTRTCGPDTQILEEEIKYLEKAEEPSTGEGKTPRRKRAPRKYAFTLNTETWQFEGIPDSQVEEWQHAYPDLDIEGELERMIQWQKTHSLKQDYPRFVVGWLNRGQHDREARHAS